MIGITLSKIGAIYMDNTKLEDHLVEDLNKLNTHILNSYQIDQNISLADIKRGLRNSDGTGVLAGITGVGSVQGYSILDGQRVPMPGRLYYRGINLFDIVDAHINAGTFGYEEVVFLLLLGQLPTQQHFDRFRELMAEARALPLGYNEDVLFRAPSKSIMNQLSRGILALYSYDDNPDDTSPDNMLRQSMEVVARMPLIVANSYQVMRHYHQGKSLYIHNPEPNLSLSENFLRMIRKDKKYTEEEAKILDMMLMIHADHGGGNNSTFTCRSVSSTGSDTYSAIAAAAGSLKGPLHGGANAKVMEMFAHIKEDMTDTKDKKELRAYLEGILDKKCGDKSGKIYGLGHAVYTMSDPRAMIIKKYARKLAEEKGRLDDLELMENIESIGTKVIMERKNRDFPLCANVDMYSGLVYQMLGIPVELYTPLFAIARSAGWCAHRMEEVISGKRIMRPAYRSIPAKNAYIPIENR